MPRLFDGIGLIALAGQIYLPPGGPMPTRMPAPPPTPPAAIVGQVTDAATGRGVPRAIVELSGADGTTNRVADDKGRFYMVGLHAGDYSISASKSGYFDGTYGQLRAGGVGRPFTIIGHEFVADLRIPLWRPSVVAGRVTDENNEPLVGVRVDVMKKQYVGSLLHIVPFASDVTDDLGAYRVANLVPGEYVVCVPSTAFSLPADALGGFVDNLVKSTQANPDADPNAADAAVITDSLFRTSNLRLDANSSHVIVPGHLNPAPPQGLMSAVYPTTYYPAAPMSSGALPVTLATGEVRVGVDVQVVPMLSGAISGTVVGPDGPASGQLLRLLNAGEDDPGLGREVAVSVSEAHGAFTFAEVPVGAYVIEAPGMATLSMGVVTSRYTQPDAPVSYTGPFSVSIDRRGDDAADSANGPARLTGRAYVTLFDRSVTDVDVRLEPALNLGGQVVLESSSQKSVEHLSTTLSLDAAPVSGQESLNRHAMVGDDGRFAIRGLARGEYFLHVSTPSGWYLKSINSAGRDLIGEPVDLTSLSDLDDLVITLTDTPARLYGAIYDWRSIPVPTATVVAFPADATFRGISGQNPERIRAFRAEVSGAFTVTGLPAGDYYIAAIDEATSDGWQDPRRLDALRQVATRVSIKAGEQKRLDLRIVTKR